MRLDGLAFKVRKNFIGSVSEMENTNIDSIANAVPKIKRVMVSNSAISPIFATLIILAVVTVLFIPVFIWTTGTTSENEDFWEASGITVTERIVIEEVNLKSTNYCTIYIRNIGKTAVTINNILITSPDKTNHVYNSGDFTPSPEYVTQGELLTIENLALDYTSGLYTIKAITPRGVADTYQVVVE